MPDIFPFSEKQDLLKKGHNSFMGMIKMVPQVIWIMLHFSGGKRFSDLGLGTHRVKCCVHKDFQLILVAEQQEVYDKFPTPLINRWAFTLLSLISKHKKLTEVSLLNISIKHEFSESSKHDLKFGISHPTPAKKTRVDQRGLISSYYWLGWVGRNFPYVLLLCV